MSAFEQLKAEYVRDRDTLSQRALAELEAKLWATVPKDAAGRRHHGLVRWFGKYMKVPMGHVEYRQYLLNARGSDPLWRRIEDKRMTLTSAVEVHRTARAYATAKRISLSAALAAVLAEYETLPVLRFEHGVPIRRRTASRFRSELANTPEPEPEPAPEPEPETPTQFIAALQKHAAAYLKERAPDVDAEDIERLGAELGVDLRDWTDRVRTAQITAQRNKTAQDHAAVIIHKITRRRFVEACKRLRMPIPGIGKPIDLDLARKQKRKLCREYHPDLRPETEHTRIEFEAIVEAYRTVERYAQQSTTRKEVKANGTT